jgi:uncharacterized membrane protein HdeD (DUF308 family)
MLSVVGVSADELRRHSGWFLALGIILVLLGVIALAFAVLTTIVSVLIFGWLLLIGGAIEVIHAFRTRRWGGFFLHLLTGLLGIVVGWLFVRHPVAGALTLTLLLGAFFLVEGIFRLTAAFSLRFPHWAWTVVGGVLTAVLGILLLLQWPVSSLWFIGFAIGIDMIFRGWAWMTMALTIRRAPA